MKKLVSILLLAVMVLSLASCSGAGDKFPFEASFEIADVKVLSAETRDPYGNGPALVVYYEITNKGTQKNYSDMMIEFTLKNGDEKVNGLQFLESVAPEEQGNEFKNIEPGETLRCCQTFSLGKDAIAEKYTLTLVNIRTEEEPQTFTINMSDVTEYKYE